MELFTLASALIEKQWAFKQRLSHMKQEWLYLSTSVLKFNDISMIFCTTCQDPGHV